MNASHFMDKQIMDLTSSPTTSSDFIDLINTPQNATADHHPQASLYNSSAANNGIKKEDIIPSYDFHPIRPLASPINIDSSPSANRTWNSDSTSNLIRNYGSLDSMEPTKAALEKDRNAFDGNIVSEIDKTMKKYADNLLHVLDGVSARLTQLETRTRNLENSVDDLKVSVGNSHGTTDGKMRQLENILREVQTGVQGLKDKQEIVEAQLQFTKLQVSKMDQQQSEPQNTGHIDSVQQAASAPPQSHSYQQPSPPPPPPPSTGLPFPLSTPPAPIPPPAVPPPPVPQQILPLQAPLPNQFPPNQIPSVPQQESYYAAPGQVQESHHQYQAPPPQQPQPSSAAPPHQPYQSAPQPQYSQPPQPQPSIPHHPEDASYLPSHTYPPSNVRQQPSQPPSGPTPPQQYYGPPANVYEPPSSRPGSGFSSGYGVPSRSSEPFPYGGPPAQHVGSPTMKPPQLSCGPMTQSAGSGYPQLPTARLLPPSLPTASPVSGGSGSSGSGNRVPVDDVVDKVASMGFPREHVRATVRKLTENGQSVDLNIVLDKLMNDGEVQPPRGWFNR